MAVGGGGGVQLTRSSLDQPYIQSTAPRKRIFVFCFFEFCLVLDPAVSESRGK